MSQFITTDQSITDQSEVTLQFSLRLEDGSLIDGTAHDATASLAMGDGSLLPGFERCLLGLRAGQEAAFTLAPEDAFGEHQPQNLRELPRDQFDNIGEPLEPGLLVSFATPEGELPGVIREVRGERVSIDFNHPLAGRTIRFEVTILAVRAADPEVPPTTH